MQTDTSRQENRQDPAIELRNDAGILCLLPEPKIRVS